MQPPTIDTAVSGLRFPFDVTLDRPDLSRRLVLARHAQKLPTVLNVEEVGRMLEAARRHDQPDYTTLTDVIALACRRWRPDRPGPIW